jgi:hypothetical protein
MAFDPLQQRTESGIFDIRHFLDDELRLASSALEWHHCRARHPSRRRGAEIATDKVQTQIQAGGGPGRGQQRTVVDV